LAGITTMTGRETLTIATILSAAPFSDLPTMPKILSEGKISQQFNYPPTNWQIA